MMVLTKDERMDLQCVCSKCETTFTMHDVEHMVSGLKGGVGWHLGKLTCPNCTTTELDFYLAKGDGKIAGPKRTESA